MSTRAQQARKEEITTGDSELPEGWASARISDVFDCWGGMTPSTSDRTYWGGNIPWLSSKDIKTLRLKNGADFITKKAIDETRLRICPKGSVITVVRSGILANCFPVAVTDAPVTVNQDLKAFWCSEPNLNEWLAISLRALESQILAENRKDGTTVQSIRVDQLNNIVMRIPPTAEQQRIAARIENLTPRIRTAAAHLARSSAIIGAFRQSVLAAACSGKLTEDWRRQVAAESADELLEHIASRRAEWTKKNKKNDEATRTERKLRSHAFDAPDDVELPSDWAWATLLQVCWLVVDCHNKTAPYQPEGVPLVRTSNIKAGRLEMDGVKHISDKTYSFWSRRCPPLPGDLLFTREAPMGECAVIPPKVKLCMGQRMMLFRTFQDLLPSQYLSIAIREPNFQKRLQQEAVGSGVRHLRVGDVERLCIAVPPTNEQHEIVHRVEALFKLADAIEKKVAAASLCAERLTQGVLAKAFRGELVPTEAELARREGREYEPASVLLERIKVERERATADKSKRKK